MRVRRSIVAFVALGSSLLSAVALPSLPARTAELELHPKSHHPTARVQALGLGFGPSEIVDIAFDRSPVAMATTDTKGQFSVWFRIPTSAKPGHHWVSAWGESSGLHADRGLTVTTPWRGIGFDMKGNRFNRYENVLIASTVGRLTKLWGWRPSEAVLSSSVAVVGDVAYVAGESGGMDLRGLTRAGSAHGRIPFFNLAAIDVRTGTEIWHVDLGVGGGKASEPVVAHGVVYLGATTDYQSWAMFAVNAATGAVIWTYDTGIDGILGSPLVEGGRVYFSAHSAVYALDGTSGALQWMFPIDDGPPDGSPALSGDLLYSQSSDVIRAIDTSTGLEEWRVDLTGGCGSIGDQSPVVVGDVVYVSSPRGILHALDAANGTERWNFGACGTPILESPVVAHGIVYLANSGGWVAAIDAETGVLRWTTFSFSTRVGSVVPGVAGDVLYVGGDTNLVALDAISGTELWSYDLGQGNGIVQQPLVISDGVLYSETCCEVAAFGLPDGA